MAITLNFASKVIYSGESTVLTAKVEDTVLSQAVFKYWVEGIPSSMVSVDMSVSGDTASVDLKTIYSAYDIDDMEFLYQVEVKYEKSNTNSDGESFVQKTEYITEVSDQQSVIFRGNPATSLRVKKVNSQDEYPIFTVRKTGVSNGSAINPNAQPFVDAFKELHVKVNNDTAMLPLVDSSHPLASDLKVQTDSGVRFAAGRYAKFRYRGGANRNICGTVYGGNPAEGTTTYNYQYSYLGGYNSDYQYDYSYTYSYIHDWLNTYSRYYAYASSSNTSSYSYNYTYVKDYNGKYYYYKDYYTTGYGYKYYTYYYKASSTKTYSYSYAAYLGYVYYWYEGGGKYGRSYMYTATSYKYYTQYYNASSSPSYQYSYSYHYMGSWYFYNIAQYASSTGYKYYTYYSYYNYSPGYYITGSYPNYRYSTSNVYKKYYYPVYAYSEGQADKSYTYMVYYKYQYAT